MSEIHHTKRLTVCAMLCALGVVMLWLGSVIEIAELSMAVIASLLCVFAVIEYGNPSAFLVFAVTAVLSLILLPNKGTAAVYLLFFGYYPILKGIFERRARFVRWLLKEAVFHAALVAIFLAWRFLLFPVENVISPWLYLVALIFAEVTFLLYDVALTRLISFYLFRLRKRFRFK